MADLSVAGLAVVADDTGRVLLIQRSSKDEEDPAAGKWEFPGGHIEPGEEPIHAAIREWQEETGCALPVGEVTDNWLSPNGIYQGFVYSIASEDQLPLNNDREARILNPDDPDGDDIEVACWWNPNDLPGMSALRDEVQDTPWELFGVSKYLDSFVRSVSSTQQPICVDIDGVCGFLIETVVTALNTQFDTTYLPSEITSYEFTTWLPKNQGEWLEAQFRKPNIYRGVAPDFAGIAACAALHRYGKEVWVVTERPENTTTVTTDWLDHWRVARDVTIVGRGMKASVAREAQEPLIFIDDDPKKIDDVAKYDNATLYLIKRPWTPRDINKANVIVFDRWVDLLTKVGVVPEIMDVPQLYREPIEEDVSKR